MKWKKLIAAALSVFIVGGTVPNYMQKCNEYTVSAVEYTDEGIAYTDYQDHVYFNEYYVVSCDKSYTGSITIPKKVRFEVAGINDFAFENALVSSISFYNQVSISKYAFKHCKNLIYFKVTDLETRYPTYKVIDNTLYDTYSNILIKCPAKSGLITVKVPDGIKEIYPYAFEECTSLTNIKLPDTLEIIGEGAFEGCKNLNEITIFNPAVNIYYSETDPAIPKDITIIGLKGSSAENYAKINGNKFVEYKEPEYDIIAVSNDSSLGSVTGGGKDITEGAAVTLTAEPEDNAIFLKWQDQDGKEFTDNPLTVTATKNMSYTAIFEEKIDIIEQPKDIVYFDTGTTVKLSLDAQGPADYYKWYFKTTDRTTFLNDDEFTADEWAAQGASYDFYGLTDKSLTDKYDGAEMYCELSSKNGQVVESEHFFLKKYKYDVDRNVAIKLPEVGQTYGEYVAQLEENVKPAELILDKEAFAIVVYDKDNHTVTQEHGFANMIDETVFKAGYKYEFTLKMYLPEDVAPSVIYQFYSKGTIVNGEEHGEADTLDEEELYFFDYWRSPVLEAPVVIGDVNGDGAIDKIDDVLLARYTSGWEGVTVDEAASDINKDGTVDLLDSVILSQYVAGWEQAKTYFTT